MSGHSIRAIWPYSGYLNEWPFRGWFIIDEVVDGYWFTGVVGRDGSDTRQSDDLALCQWVPPHPRER